MKNKITMLGPYLALAAMVLASHGWLLLNQGVYWDDWLIKGFLEDENWGELQNMTSEMGLPILAYFFWSIKLLGLTNSYKVVAFTLILLSSYVVYQIGLESGRLFRSEALLIALFSVVYPAFQTSVLLTTLQYQFFYYIFLLSVLCFLLAEKPEASQKHRLRLLSLSFILFFISFNLNSLLVYYFPVLCFLLFNSRQFGELSHKQKFVFTLQYRTHFVLLPLVYWSIKKIIFPVHGLYKNYNSLKFDGALWRFDDSIRVSVFHQISTVTSFLLGNLTVVLLVAAASSLTYFLLRGLDKDVTTIRIHGIENSRRLVWLLNFGMALLICAVAPYAVAGHVLGSTGWNTRHAVLVGLPMALILTAIIRWIYLIGKVQKTTLHNIFGLASVAAQISCMAVFAFTTAEYYATLQLRAIKDTSVMTKLRNQDALKVHSIYWIDDRFPIGGDPYYSYYEWSSMFKSIWGGQSRIGIQLQYAGRPVNHDIPDKIAFTSRYNLAEFNPKGSQACLRIFDGMPNISKWQLIYTYLLLQTQSRIGLDGKQLAMEGFLEDATRVEASELHINIKTPDPIEGCALLNVPASTS